jgi:hypothetical protein
MTVTIPVEINQSSIDNGRIYIDAKHEPLFKGLRLGGRAEGEHGDTVMIEAGGNATESDIRRFSGARLSPRISFKAYLKSVGAAAGDMFNLVELGPRQYRLGRS